MQLVGATKRFIQIPFLISNFKSAFIASVLGNIMLVLLFLLVVDMVPELKDLFSQKKFIALIIGTSIINLLISFFSTLICVRKYLNLNTEDLYE